MIRRKTPLARGAPPQRTGPIARSGRIRHSPEQVEARMAGVSLPRFKPNRKRRMKAFALAYHSKARVRFVSQLPCAACGYCGAYARQNAHTKTGGTSLKAHYTTIIPLCGPCHTKQHGPNGGWLAIGMTAESCARAAMATEILWTERGANADLDEAA